MSILIKLVKFNCNLYTLYVCHVNLKDRELSLMNVRTQVCLGPNTHTHTLSSRNQLPYFAVVFKHHILQKAGFSCFIHC